MLKKIKSLKNPLLKGEFKMKILDYTKLGINLEQLGAIKHALMLVGFEDHEQSLTMGDLKVDYWIHTIPNVHEDKIKVVRISCI